MIFEAGAVRGKKQNQYDYEVRHKNHISWFHLTCQILCFAQSNLLPSETADPELKFVTNYH